MTTILSDKNTIKDEWKGLLTLLSFLLLVNLMPFLHYLQTNQLILSFIKSPTPFIWVFIFWFFGYPRLLVGAIMFNKSLKNQLKPSQPKLLKENLITLAQSEGLTGNYTVLFHQDTTRPPYFFVIFQPPKGKAHIIESSDNRLDFLINPFFGTQSQWTTLLQNMPFEKIFVPNCSAHDQLNALQKTQFFVNKHHSLPHKLAKFLPKGKLNSIVFD